jgi:transposase
LHELVGVLKKHDIVSVAMESTGVYWTPLFLLLQENGIESCPVNAAHVKNVTGRKDDEGDAEWLQKLHRCGLLTASFQLDGFTKELWTIVRTRDTFL